MGKLKRKLTGVLYLVIVLSLVFGAPFIQRRVESSRDCDGLLDKSEGCLETLYYRDGPDSDFKKCSGVKSSSGKNWEVKKIDENIPPRFEGGKSFLLIAERRVANATRSRELHLAPPTQDDIRYSADCAITWSIKEAVDGDLLGEPLPCSFPRLPLDCYQEWWEVTMEDVSSAEKIFKAVGKEPWAEGEEQSKTVTLNEEADPPCWEIPYGFELALPLETDDAIFASAEDGLAADAERAIRAYVRGDHQFDLYSLCAPTWENPTGKWEVTIVYGADTRDRFVKARQQGGAWRMQVSLTGDLDYCWQLKGLTRVWDDAT